MFQTLEVREFGDQNASSSVKIKPEIKGTKRMMRTDM